MGLRKRAVIFVAILAFTVAFDQGSKAWARTLPVHPAGCAMPDDFLSHRCGGVPQPVIDGYWDWELAFNPGAAFSSFIGGTLARVMLSLIAAVALIAIGVMATRTTDEQGLKRAGFALVAGGALGNLIDRLRDGAVTDFVSWRWHEHRWPMFNVADAALLVGVLLLLIDSALAHRRMRAA